MGKQALVHIHTILYDLIFLQIPPTHARIISSEYFELIAAAIRNFHILLIYLKECLLVRFGYHCQQARCNGNLEQITAAAVSIKTENKNKKYEKY